MGSLEELNSTLRMATALLDAAVVQVRDLAVSPVRDHIRLIGDAMAKVFEIQETIYQLRPELRPAYLDQRSPNPEADRRLTRLLGDAYRRSDSGDRLGAIELLQSFASTETSELHLEIARHEIERLQGQPNA
ncbi:MAG: hypothetical protein ACRDGM_14925 [bacterium]